MINKEEFIDWQKNPVTQAVFAAIVEKINLGATELSYSAGVSPEEDRYKCGMIGAYRSMLSIEFDELEEATKDA